MFTEINLRLLDVPNISPIVLKLRNASTKDKFLLRDVSGITPPGKNLFLSELARDGSIYNGRRVGNRNVVVTFDLNPDPSLGETVSDLRDWVQRVVMGSVGATGSETPVQIFFRHQNSPYKYTYARLETFESGLFSEENTIQLSFLCPNPYILGATVIIQKTPGYVRLPLSYEGTAECGFRMEVAIETHNASQIVLMVNSQTMVFNFPFNLRKGDTISINTEPGNRRVTRTSLGVTTNILPYLNPSSRWLTIGPQTQTVSVVGRNASDYPAAITSLIYIPHYWGV